MAPEQGFQQKAMLELQLLRPARSVPSMNGNTPATTRHGITPMICSLSSTFHCALPRKGCQEQQEVDVSSPGFHTVPCLAE